MLQPNYSSHANIISNCRDCYELITTEQPSALSSVSNIIPETIVELNEENFRMIVMESSMSWAIVFYSSFDHYIVDSSTISTYINNDKDQRRQTKLSNHENNSFWTTKMAIEFIHASNTLKGWIEFGAIDCDQNPQLQRLFAIESCPTILHFHDGQQQQQQQQQQWQQNQLNREQLPSLSMPFIHSDYTIFNRVKKLKIKQYN
ncbi:hypothetical protein HUG17_3802 [Dermatophagoides farinae]|uniref:Thioredoxin domain-containing protein n=2 Tax=Dermatophagoides farinae TaxID=6954 RepID=A0A9D4NX98_DERFA|nr:hypothetical protein HUG17_3802 [Dermatophagoides farinae]